MEDFQAASDRRGTACKAGFIKHKVIRQYHVRLQQLLHILHRTVYERTEKRAVKPEDILQEIANTCKRRRAGK